MIPPPTSKSLFLLASIFAMLNCGNSQDPQSTNGQNSVIFSLVQEGRIATDGGQTRGVAWGDYDGDGDPDLYVANSAGQWNAFYRNDGGGIFHKITAPGNRSSEAVIHGGNSEGVNWVDYDNDGDLDLYVLSRGEESNLLFRNDDKKGFTRITGSPLTDERISASMACWADVDGDGDLDVFIAGYDHPNVVFENLGDGNFESVDDSVLSGGAGRARACACGDANDDGLPEFYVANARMPNSYFVNMGNWKFEQINRGHLVEDIGYSYGVSWADYDNDDDLDLFVANFDKENFLYSNDGEGNLSTVLTGDLASEKEGASKGHSWGDYDNDGDLDLYIANGTYSPRMHNFLFLNQGDGSFQKHYDEVINAHADTSAGAAHADYDRDGDLDLFVANWGSRDQLNRLYENKTDNGNWITLRLIGQSSNYYAVGAKVQAYISKTESRKRITRWMYPVTGYGSQNDYELHFGLGDFTTIDSLVIRWPSGQQDIHTGMEKNNHFMAKELGEISITN